MNEPYTPTFKFREVWSGSHFVRLEQYWRHTKAGEGEWRPVERVEAE